MTAWATSPPIKRCSPWHATLMVPTYCPPSTQSTTTPTQLHGHSTCTPLQVASLGATCFIVFAAPRSESARPRVLLGGYLVGTFSGTLCSLLARSSLVTSVGVSQNKLLVIFGALAVGLAISIMVFTNTGHPPAAGLALGFVLSPWNYATIILVLSAAGLLSLVRWLLRKVLVDLV